MNYQSVAKINLALDILSRDPNGYHRIRTVFQEIPLFDSVEINRIEGNGGFKVIFRGPEAKQINPHNNTVLSAIQLLQKQWKFKYSYEIIIQKRIPLAAGLGGGSSNAATVIKALNALELMKLTYDEERAVAVQVGMDAPFFIEEGAAIGTHYGEKIENIPSLSRLSGWQEKPKLLVIKAERNITSEMYQKVDLTRTGKDIEKTLQLIDAMKAGDTEKTLSYIHNDFEYFVGPYFTETKNILMKTGADHVLLCGSGTGILATFNNPYDLEALSQELPNRRILGLTQ